MEAMHMTRYPRVTGITLENFMGYEFAEAEFDESNIINFKGYNASGKSAVIKAFWVVFYNFKHNRQVRWIKHGTDSFVINVTFDDGNTLQRGKLKNGKSWYTLLNERSEELYTTIVDGIYQQVIDVPEVIKKYLGLSYNTKLNPHFLRSRDPLFLVDTTGGENYRYLSAALQGDELIKAGELAKVEQKALKESMDYIGHELSVYKDIYAGAKWLTKGLVEQLELLDASLTKAEDSKVQLNTTFELTQTRSTITVLPELEKIQQEAIETLHKTGALYQTVGTSRAIQPIPELQYNLEGIKNTLELQQIYNTQKQKIALKEVPHVPTIQNNTLQKVTSLQTIQTSVQRAIQLNPLPSVKGVQVPDELGKLSTLLTLVKNNANKPDPTPELSVQQIPINKIQLLSKLQQLATQYTQLKETPELPLVDSKPGFNTALGHIIERLVELENKSAALIALNTLEQQIKQEQQTLFKEMHQQGYEMYECSCCGELNLVGEEHTHE